MGGAEGTEENRKDMVSIRGELDFMGTKTFIWEVPLLEKDIRLHTQN